MDIDRAVMILQFLKGKVAAEEKASPSKATDARGPVHRGNAVEVLEALIAKLYAENEVASMVAVAGSPPRMPGPAAGPQCGTWRPTRVMLGHRLPAGGSRRLSGRGVLIWQWPVSCCCRWALY